MRVPADPQTGPNFRRQGAIILSVFALIWAMAGASGIGAGIAFWGIGAFALAVTVGAPRSQCVQNHSHGSSPPAAGLAAPIQHRGIVQGVAIRRDRRIDFHGSPASSHLSCFIVGLHFLPLERTFDQPEYRATALPSVAWRSSAQGC